MATRTLSNTHLQSSVSLDYRCDSRFAFASTSVLCSLLVRSTATDTVSASCLYRVHTSMNNHEPGHLQESEEQATWSLELVFASGRKRSQHFQYLIARTEQEQSGGSTRRGIDVCIISASTFSSILSCADRINQAGFLEICFICGRHAVH